MPSAPLPCISSRKSFALGFASPGKRAPAPAGCAPHDCHALPSDRTIFSPSCLNPRAIIYLKRAPPLALRHVSGNGNLRLCPPHPCPAFARLGRGFGRELDAGLGQRPSWSPRRCESLWVILARPRHGSVAETLVTGDSAVEKGNSRLESPGGLPPERRRWLGRKTPRKRHASARCFSAREQPSPA